MYSISKSEGIKHDYLKAYRALQGDYIEEYFTTEEFTEIRNSYISNNVKDFGGKLMSFFFISSFFNSKLVRREGFKLDIMPSLDFFAFKCRYFGDNFFERAMSWGKPKKGLHTYFTVKSNLFKNLFDTKSEYGFDWNLLKKDFNWTGLDEKAIQFKFKERTFSEIGIRIIGNHSIDIESVLKGTKDLKQEEKQKMKKVIVHIHGGAYIKLSSKNYLDYLIKVVKETDVIVFSIDYLLAPVSKTNSIFRSLQESYLLINVV